MEVSIHMLFVLWQGNIVLSYMIFHLVLCYSSTAGGRSLPRYGFVAVLWEKNKRACDVDVALGH